MQKGFRTNGNAISFLNWSRSQAAISFGTYYYTSSDRVIQCLVSFVAKSLLERSSEPEGSGD